jgi:hypothetical protein
MKKIFLNFVLVAFGCYNAISQGCLPEGITFNYQYQIDSFQVNYPGCTEIEGNVNIENKGWSWIFNLNGLSGLTSIGGSLNISSSSLSSLAGLNTLTSIGGDLSLDGNWNESLTSLAALDGLTFIGGNLSVRGYRNLTSLAGLENVSAASIDNIDIYDNIALSACNIQSLCEYLAAPNGTVNIYSNATGCNSPAEIANMCGITMPCLPYGNYYFFSQADVDNFKAVYPGCSDLQGDVSITGDDIINLSVFSEVTSIAGDLNIGRYYDRTPIGNPLLRDLNGLENLTQIGGTLLIIRNGSLTSLSGLDNLSSIGNDLLIGIEYSHTTKEKTEGALTSINALSGLASIGGQLYIESTSLTSLTGLDSVFYIGSNINIIGNKYLSDISGLAKLNSITGTLSIAITAITSLKGLNNVSRISGSVFIGNNHRLKNFEGLENLSYIGTGAWIFDNDSLTSMVGFDNLEYIDGYLDIWDNPSLSSLSGLENLDSIGSYLHISQNALTSLTALSGLQSIKGTLYIVYNDNLTSLSGLDNLFTDSVSELKLFYNSQLQTCDVQSICNYLAGPYGTAEIYGNASGCNSPAEVEAACSAVSVNDFILADGFSIYPDPANYKIYIANNNNLKGESTICIFNMNGAILQQDKFQNQNLIELDVSALTKGIYLVKIQTSAGIETKKLVIQ